MIIIIEMMMTDAVCNSMMSYKDNDRIWWWSEEEVGGAHVLVPTCKATGHRAGIKENRKQTH